MLCNRVAKRGQRFFGMGCQLQILSARAADPYGHPGDRLCPGHTLAADLQCRGVVPISELEGTARGNRGDGVVSGQR